MPRELLVLNENAFSQSGVAYGPGHLKARKEVSNSHQKRKCANPQKKSFSVTKSLPHEHTESGDTQSNPDKPETQQNTDCVEQLLSFGNTVPGKKKPFKNSSVSLFWENCLMERLAVVVCSSWKWNSPGRVFSQVSGCTDNLRMRFWCSTERKLALCTFPFLMRI